MRIIKLECTLKYYEESYYKLEDVKSGLENILNEYGFYLSNLVIKEYSDEMINKCCLHFDKAMTFTKVYWACDECFDKYTFDPIKHTIIGLNENII